MKALLLMTIMGLLSGFLLCVANRVFYVKKDIRFEKLLTMLPGYNCGACGYPGCSGMATALLKKETDTLTCRPCKPDQRYAILEYLNHTPDEEGNLLKVKSI